MADTRSDGPGSTPAGEDEKTRMIRPERPASGKLPKNIGPYEIVKSLGEGGMGIVLLGRDKELRRDVAIKLVRGELQHNEQFIERFFREARLCASLNHPNIVTTYQVGRHDDAPYIVLEYVEGHTLRELLRTPPPLALTRVLDIVGQASDGLDTAARKGIVHRDVKPANIMVRGDDLVKVMDFGLSKEVEGEKLTMTSALVGTPDYMSPEQAAGRHVDYRTDVYALGITLFQCVTGYLPFKSSSVFETIRMHAEKPLPEDPRLVSLLDGRLLGLIKLMTAKRVEERLSNYVEIRRELRAMRDLLAARGEADTHKVLPPQPPTFNAQHLHEAIERTESERRAQQDRLPRLTPPSGTRVSGAASGGRTRGLWIGVAAAVLLIAVAVVAFIVSGAEVRITQKKPLQGTAANSTPPTPAEPHVATEPATQTARNVIAGPVTFASSRNPAASSADVLEAIGALGSNHLIAKEIQPTRVPMAASFRERTTRDVLEVICLAAGWELKDEHGLCEIAKGKAPATEAIRSSREKLDAEQLPKVSANAVAQRVTVRMFCDAISKDAGLDYVIVGGEVANASLPSGSFTRQPLPFMMDLINKRSIPIEWTVQKSTLIITPGAAAR
jgi:serine/threonine protein kinase